MRSNGHRATPMQVYHQAQRWQAEVREGGTRQIPDGYHPPTYLLGYLNRCDWART
jgi:hypothetical protein